MNASSSGSSSSSVNVVVVVVVVIEDACGVRPPPSRVEICELRLDLHLAVVGAAPGFVHSFVRGLCATYARASPCTNRIAQSKRRTLLCFYFVRLFNFQALLRVYFVRRFF